MSPIGAPGRHAHVLLVDDSPGDSRLTQEAFREASKTIRLHVASDGVEAMAFPRREGAHARKPRPDLSLLFLVTSINDFWLTKVKLPQPELVG